MKLFTSREMRAVDRAAMDAGIPSLILMETAGRKVADAVLTHVSSLHASSNPGTLLVLCGKGNNGGDGYVVARHLRQAGRDVRVLELSAELSGDPAVMRGALIAVGAKPSCWT